MTDAIPPTENLMAGRSPFRANLEFAPGPAQAKVDKVAIGSESVVFLVLATPQAALGTIWSVDEAINLANTILEAASGLTVAHKPLEGLVLPPTPNGDHRP